MELFGKYEAGRLLGCGAFAKVYYARNIQNGQSVAIKVINKKKISGTTLMSNIKREIVIMRRLRHPNIVRLYEVMATKSKIFFVMELVKGGELFAKVAKGRFSEDLSRNYFRQLISAISYCHSRGVYHRDLKPENLLVDEDGNLKVSDFGLSALKLHADADAESHSSLLHTLCGTPAYVAPEILAKKGYDGAKVDVWSCGVILFVLTAGYLPFNDPNLMAMYKKIYKGEFRCPKWMSSDIKRFLSRLLDTNPNTRITLDQIIRDPWFTKGNPHFTFNYGDQDDASDHQLEDDDDDDDVPESSSSSSDNAIPKKEQEQLHKSVSLNAFDLISFSSGLDLSGLFQDSFNPIVQAQRFLSAEPADKILTEIEKAAAAENVKVKKKKKKKEEEEDYCVCVVDLQGSNANFVAKLEISPLTDKLLVTEVKKTAGDSASFTLFWNNKIRPLVSELVYHPDPHSPTAPLHHASTL